MSIIDIKFVLLGFNHQPAALMYILKVKILCDPYGILLMYIYVITANSFCKITVRFTEHQFGLLLWIIVKVMFPMNCI